MWKHYYRLCKPGISRMVMISAAFGYLMGGSQGNVGFSFIFTLNFLLSIIGIGLATAGSSVLNNFLERDIDGLMDRTKNRALPQGIISAERALGFGLLLTLAGVGILLFWVNLLTAFLVLLSAFLYVVVYTPLKRRTWLNTSIGAVPGALPMTCGWVASSPAPGYLDFGAFVVFGLLYAWQHPHFYAIAWMYKEDYRKGGFKMLSVVDETGHRLFIQVILFSFCLLAVSIVPSLTGMTGTVYLIGASLLGIYMIYYSLMFVARHTRESARALLKASIIYLPALLLVVAIDVAVS
jgi:protoheme IX farnesyltransferase